MRHIILTIALTLGLATPAAAADMILKSTDFTDGATLSNAQVYNGFGCEGDNISPALSWENVPEGTKSLALNVYDPDAPTGSGWWHWVVFNMPATTTHLESGASGHAMPEGTIESRTDYAATGFGGACPPQGDKPHRYIFTLYALDIEKLDLDEMAPAAMVGFYLHNHTIAKASITARYGR